MTANEFIPVASVGLSLLALASSIYFSKKTASYNYVHELENRVARLEQDHKNCEQDRRSLKEENHALLSENHALRMRLHEA